MRSDQQPNSRYAQGGDTDVIGNRLGWWERKPFTKSVSDIPYVISKKYDARPDLLAYDMYGQPTMQWFILQYNNIIDITTEFVVGAQIVLPTKARLYSELLSKHSW